MDGSLHFLLNGNETKEKECSNFGLRYCYADGRKKSVFPCGQFGWLCFFLSFAQIGEFGIINVDIKNLITEFSYNSIR